MTLPTMNTPMSPIRRPLRGTRVVRPVITGPPITTAIAYAVTSRPAVGTETLRSAERLGSTPLGSSSAVPTQNTHSVSATRIRDIGVLNDETARTYMQTTATYALAKLGVNRIRRSGR